MPPMMPIESAKHERTWMAWPSATYSLGESTDEVEAARSTWAAVALAVARFEPVSMVVDPSDVAIARSYLGDGIDLVEAPLDDAWMRDMGPTFVRDGDRIAAVNWVFNGWGAQDWAEWGKDQHIGSFVADASGTDRIDSPLVNEGGGIHVDGEGTVLVTRTVQLDPGRNPHLTEADVEAELARTIGATTAIWLPRGLTRDAERFGTRGHVDIVATFTRPGTVLVHTQQDERHPDAAVSREVIEILSGARDAAGRRLEIIELPAPETLRDDEGFVDYSYVNHYVLNGAVIGCAFDDPGDERAAAILRDAYPGREVVMVDARPLFAAGGGIHCITQQQPAL